MLGRLQMHFIRGARSLIFILGRHRGAIQSIALTVYRFLRGRRVRGRMGMLRGRFARTKRLTLTGRCTRVCHIIVRLFSGFMDLLKSRQVTLGRCERLLSTKVRRTVVNMVPPDLSRIVTKSVRQAELGSVQTLVLLKIGSSLVPKGTSTNKLVSSESQRHFRREKVTLTPKAERGDCVRGFCLCLRVAGPARRLVLACDGMSTSKGDEETTCLVKSLGQVCAGLPMFGVSRCKVRAGRVLPRAKVKSLVRKLRGPGGVRRND